MEIHQKAWWFLGMWDILNHIYMADVNYMCGCLKFDDGTGSLFFPECFKSSKLLFFLEGKMWSLPQARTNLSSDLDSTSLNKYIIESQDLTVNGIAWNRSSLPTFGYISRRFVGRKWLDMLIKTIAYATSHETRKFSVPSRFRSLFCPAQNSFKVVYGRHVSSI